MRCTRARNLISADLDGELDAVRSEDMRAHLEACAACRTFAAGLDGLGQDLDMLASAEQIEPRWGFAERVAARIENEPTQGVGFGSWAEFLRPAPVGLALVSFGVGVLLAVLAEAAPSTETAGVVGDDPMAALLGEYDQTDADRPVEDRLLELLTDEEE
ncbi:MAG: hypothetical protein GY778_23000 [bacterium]|nr:hypothetical protein [bacterium]